MNIDGFSEPQRQGLLDLIVLAMYADGNLALAEASRVDGILTAMGFATAYDRQREFDASVTRVRQRSGSKTGTFMYTAELTRHFTTKEQKRQACDLIEELLSSDNQVAAAETRFLEHIRQEFQL
jgi:hypothetical protein